MHRHPSNLGILGVHAGADVNNHFGSLNGLYYGIDVGAAGIQLISNRGANLLLDFSGQIISSSTSSTSITGIGSYNGTMYAINSSNNKLGYLDGNNFTAIGSLGTVVGNINGFDISANGTAYLASGYGTDAIDSNLYIVDLVTGQASLNGTIGDGTGPLVYGITIVPEPATCSLALITGLVWLNRRRK
jgi:hypothetical protein